MTIPLLSKPCLWFISIEYTPFVTDRVDTGIEQNATWQANRELNFLRSHAVRLAPEILGAIFRCIQVDELSGLQDIDDNMIWLKWEHANQWSRITRV